MGLYLKQADLACALTMRAAACAGIDSAGVHYGYLSLESLCLFAYIYGFVFFRGDRPYYRRLVSLYGFVYPKLKLVDLLLRELLIKINGDNILCHVEANVCAAEQRMRNS